MNNRTKYRPYLTLDDMRAISASLKQTTGAPIPLIRYLDSYISQIEQGLRESALTLAPTMEEKLGFSQLSPSQVTSRAQYMLRILSAWENPVTRGTLTVQELMDVQNYRYTHDLMTQEEAKAYEETLF